MNGGATLFSEALSDGGFDAPSSAIDGTWRGDLFQGAILCPGGTSIGAGGGSAIRSAELEVSGSDEIGSAVQEIDGNCLLEGTRDADGFRAAAI
jgi:hypothetical protein